MDIRFRIKQPINLGLRTLNIYSQSFKCHNNFSEGQNCDRPNSPTGAFQDKHWSNNESVQRVKLHNKINSIVHVQCLKGEGEG